jgi:hypothetical protein
MSLRAGRAGTGLGLITPGTRSLDVTLRWS